MIVILHILIILSFVYLTSTKIWYCMDNAIYVMDFYVKSEKKNEKN